MTVAAFAMDISTDYDHKADFSKYKTFTWIHPPKLQDPFMQQRVADGVNQLLQAKGLLLVTNPDAADLGLTANGATQEKHTLQTFYDGFPGGWGWGGWGTASTLVDTYQVGTLVVDMFDMDTKQVVWRSIATETLSDKPSKNAKKVNEAVEKMLKDFPPRPK
jgi:hypothetical protein